MEPNKGFCGLIILERHIFNIFGHLISYPDEYKRRVCTKLLSTEDCEFMIELVHDQPFLFLIEIHEQTYDSQGTLMSLQVIHNNLVNKMSITFKKADTVNIGSLFSKYAWIERMKDVPAKSLVFTVCDFDLLHMFSQSSHGLPSKRDIMRQNPERLSTLMDTYNSKKYKNFLKYNLVCTQQSTPHFYEKTCTFTVFEEFSSCVTMMDDDLHNGCGMGAQVNLFSNSHSHPPVQLIKKLWL
ncbi:hypothetical protein VP01_5425g1 [Puccinia sorghi]|uniref:Uncharacterized protein n=1 Tax=Puccinia sorghi TaxID=27349 RepID=A0A0L6UJS3_9BASI|nr:hypothetical protein VP01_5425g1 [Puccinia sorghi]